MYYQSPYFNQSDYANVDKDILGNYAHSNSRSQFVTLMGILTYKINLISDLTLDLLAGGEVKTRTGISSLHCGKGLPLFRAYIVWRMYVKFRAWMISGFHIHNEETEAFLTRWHSTTKVWHHLAPLPAGIGLLTLSQEFSPYFILQLLPDCCFPNS